MGLMASFVNNHGFRQDSSKEEVGTFFLVMMVVQLAASLGDFGLRNTAIRFLSEPIDYDDPRRYRVIFGPSIACFPLFQSL
jgi:O-antigen/teichoic acid export membrane protein